jgi:hypothetical protein
MLNHDTVVIVSVSNYDVSRFRYELDFGVAANTLFFIPTTCLF